MPERKFTAASAYRYGFNGKENDNEVKGEGNQQDYGMRVYDPRLGKFLSLDPFTKKYPELTPFQFASNRCIQGIDLDGKEVFLVTGQGGIFGLVAGYDIGGGIAFGKDGIALVAVQTLKGGLGLEISATVSGTLYPTMEGVSDMETITDTKGGGIDMGYSISGGWLGDVGIGASKSGSHWGGTVSYGVGVGAHASFDGIMTISKKVITWKDIVKVVSETTEQSRELKSFFGITDKNIANTEQIVKDYFVKMGTSLRDKRIEDLKKENTNNENVIKEAKGYLDDYKKSGWIYRLFNFKDKKSAEILKSSAEDKIESNKAEIKKLEKTEIKF